MQLRRSRCLTSKRFYFKGFMHVVKRNGQTESVKFDKITARINKLCEGLNDTHINEIEVAKRVIQGLYDGVTTQELDNLAAETAASMAVTHSDYGRLAARIAISNLHKLTSSSFSNTMGLLYKYIDSKTGKNAPLISTKAYGVIKEYAARLDDAIDYSRDYSYDYFGFRTLERSYLMRIDGAVVERPQHMLMRVAVGVHQDDIDSILEAYELLSQRWFTHATPTLFNAGTPKPQLSSCFLLTMKEDSIDGIYDTLKQCAKISQSAGGIGLSVHQVRATGSYIRGTNGTSNGLVPMLRAFDMTARYVDQGGGKRKGSFAIYLEPWHADIYDLLQLKKNHGKEELRARDLFYALWVPDLFMKRVEADKKWSLFCPNEAPGLFDCHGEAFERLYEKYEAEGKARRQVSAQDLWFEILEAQIETGVPYILYKDPANSKSNHQHLGTLRSSNLCTEIMEYTSKEEVAVCNLASLALPKYVREDTKDFDFDRLYEVTYAVTKSLDKVIDVNYYPVEEAAYSNKRHRPIGIGVQGLADVFLMLRYSFDSKEARQLNKDIFETIYFSAMTASKDLAIEKGTYETYKGSPTSKGLFQFDLWGVTEHSGRWDWYKLKREVKEHGLRNSLLVAPMPTASTSQILGNNECFEPYTSNVYVRRVLSGEFIVVNKHLVADLVRLGLWNEQTKNELMAAKGSVQEMGGIPDDLKQLYRTVWEIPQRAIIDMAADRAPYICQSQSLNIHIEDPTFSKLTSMHFYAWRKGLKTGMYYLRSRPAADAIAFTVDQQQLKKNQPNPSTEGTEGEPTPAIAQNEHELNPNSTSHCSANGTCLTNEEEICESCSS